MVDNYREEMTTAGVTADNLDTFLMIAPNSGSKIDSVGGADNLLLTALLHFYDRPSKDVLIQNAIAELGKAASAGIGELTDTSIDTPLGTPVGGGAHISVKGNDIPL